MTTLRFQYIAIISILSALLLINLFYNHGNFSTPKIPTKTLPRKSLNSYQFGYVLNPRHVCANNPQIELVICVPISRDNFAGRRVISETWGTYAYEKRNKAALFFFIGNGSNSEAPEIQTRILKESREYNDIVQLDYTDSYQNLSIKSISILKWVSTFCWKAKFVLKADDDVYVNVKNLMSLLRSEEEQNPKGMFILGRVFRGAAPIRHKSSKWYMSYLEYFGSTYPAYVSGTCYAMTIGAAKKIFDTSQSQNAPLIWLEDIYITGICRSKAGVYLVNSDDIDFYKPKPSGCIFRDIISGHRYTEAQLRHIYEEVNDPNLDCET